MAIQIKDQSGEVHEVSSRGTVNAALATGIVGTALGVLNGGLGNGILGGLANNASSEMANGAAIISNVKDVAGCCFVEKDQFYNTLISQINTQAERDISTERRFANIEAMISVNTTANQYQNTIIQNQFEWERLLSEKNLALATCRCVQGDVFLSPRHLADSYVSPTRVLDSHEAREYLPGRPACNYGPCGGFGAY